MLLLRVRLASETHCGSEKNKFGKRFPMQLPNVHKRIASTITFALVNNSF